MACSLNKHRDKRQKFGEDCPEDISFCSFAKLRERGFKRQRAKCGSDDGKGFKGD
jgi:hypothetical protein